MQSKRTNRGIDFLRPERTDRYLKRPAQPSFPDSFWHWPVLMVAVLASSMFIQLAPFLAITASQHSDLCVLAAWEAA